MQNTLIYLVVGVILGALSAGAIVYLFLRVKAETSRSEAGAAQSTLTERDQAIAELKEIARLRDSELQDLRSTLTQEGEKLRLAEAGKARLDGIAETVQALRADLDTKDEEVRGHVQRITVLSTELAEAKTKVEETEKATAATLTAMERRCQSDIVQKETAVADLIREKDQALASHRKALEDSCAAQIAEKDRAIEEQKRLLADTERVLGEKFSVVSAESLKNATEEFLKLATAKFETSSVEAQGDLEKRQQAIDHLLKPLGDSLANLEKRSMEMEQRRVSAYEAVSGQVERLMQQTGYLSNALRRPSARGSWGEITLRTVAENAGLVEGHDFDVQHTTDTDDGKLRADMVVRLPKKRAIVIDCKTPIDSYREAVNCEDEAAKEGHLVNHARLVRSHVAQLASKGYQDQYEGVDYVVMFLPTESIYQAALEQDSTLIEYAMKNRVLIANPMTLIGLLKAVACVLDQERLNEDALAVSKIGRNLYEGIQSYAGHVTKLGKHLKKSVETYNDSVGSLERMVLSRARQLKSKSDQAIDEIGGVEALPVGFRSRELVGLEEPTEPLAALEA